MSKILEEIVAFKRKEVADFKQELPQVYLESRTEIIINNKCASMSQSLSESATGIIAEFKRKSPSLGWIKQEATGKVIPLSYQKNGATALSILTDAYFFGGSNVYVRTARMSGVYLPILYKNFIIDEYQIYQAKISGASAILLIAACLTKEECSRFITLAHQLRMEVLLEMHTEEETEYAELGPDMCGINNRNLDTFETDVNTSLQLIGRLPADVVKVSESGISSPETVKQLRAVGYRGFLIGEHFMKEADPGAALNEFIAQL